MSKVGDGTPDAALAIGEDAFRAGWAACMENVMPGRVGPPIDVNDAWSRYDPPEDIKAMS